MLCINCSKLAFVSSPRNCLRCNGTILNNLSVVCDNCSNSERLCSVCLKKMISPAVRNRSRSNCGSCGK